MPGYGAQQAAAGMQQMSLGGPPGPPVSSVTVWWLCICKLEAVASTKAADDCRAIVKQQAWQFSLPASVVSSVC
jgi:hypothetical protein